MLQAIYWELKKIGKNKFIWGLFVFFLIADAYKMTHTYFGINDTTKGEQAIYHKLAGNITEEKVLFLIDNVEKYSQLIESGEYSTAGNQKGTYTGYIMGDYNIFSSCYENMKKAYDYKQYAAKICEKAKQNAQLYESRNVSYELKKNNMIYHNFLGREIKNYYNCKVSNALFSYDFSTIFMILLVITVVGSVLVLEQDHHMYEILETVSFGNRRRTQAKLWSIAIFCAIVVGIFIFWDCCVLQMQYGLIDNWKNPVYSMTGYENSPLRCSIIAYLGIWMMQRYLVVLFFALITFVMYDCCLNGVRTVAFSIAIYVVFVVICIQTNWFINPISLCNGQELIKKTTFVNCFETPFYDYEIVTTLTAAGVLLLSVLILYIGTKQNVSTRVKISDI